jgi:hypothetical protein
MDLNCNLVVFVLLPLQFNIALGQAWMCASDESQLDDEAIPSYSYFNGTIYSPNYPAGFSHLYYRTRMCSLRLVAPTGCRLIIKKPVTDLNSTICPATDNTATCTENSCENIKVQETGYVGMTSSFKLWTENETADYYQSKTRSVTLTYCQTRSMNNVERRFSILYEVNCTMDVQTVLPTSDGTPYETDRDVVVSGVLTNLGFPHGYKLNYDRFYYSIVNNYGGHIRLTFDDWNIAAVSVLKIYNDALMSTNNNSTFTGAGTRPVVQSLGSELFIEFFTGRIFKAECVSLEADARSCFRTVRILGDRYRY